MSDSIIGIPHASAGSGGGGGDLIVHTHLDDDNGGFLSASAINSGTLNVNRIPSLPASQITSGQLVLARGGTGADLSATGSATHFLRQASAGAAITVGAIVSADIATALTTPGAIGGTTPAAIAGTVFTGNSLILNGAPGKIQPAVNSTTAINIAQADGTAYGIWDTTNRRLTIASGGQSILTLTSTAESGFRLIANSAGTQRNWAYVIDTAGTFYWQYGGTFNSFTIERDVPTNTIVVKTSGLTGFGVALPAARVHAQGIASGIGMIAQLHATTPGDAFQAQLSTGNKIAAINNMGNLELWGDSSTSNRQIGSVVQTFATSTDASRKGRVIHSVYDTAAREGLRIEADGSNPMIGFLGASAIARQTVSGTRIDPEGALKDLLTKLATLGLITDSTTMV